MRMDMLNPPYDDRMAEWVPPGVEVEPLSTVRIMLKHAEGLANAMKNMAWFFLDAEQSTVDVRTREVVVARTCARNGSEYQWGNHQGVFGAAAGFTDEERYSTVHGSADDAVWGERDRALLRAVDELIDTKHLSDGVYAQLRSFLDEGQILEVSSLVGWYTLNSLNSNVMQAPLEPFTVRFP